MLVKVVSHGTDQDAYNSAASDLAWESAVYAASQEGIELGSEDFIVALDYLNARYQECAQSYGHLRSIAARTVKILMDHGLSVTYPEDACDCDGHLTNYIEGFVSVVLSTITSLYSVGPAGWVSNAEWQLRSEHERSTYFNVTLPTSSQEEEEDEATHG